MPNLSEVKPTYFPSVPRIFEKIYTAATAAIEKEGGAKKKIFDWSIEVGKRFREAERAGGAGGLLKAQHKLADRLVLEKIRNLFGGNLRVAVTGAAPINPEILRFFDAAGVLVLEGWGMTETSTAATIATPDDFKFGTVGQPLPGLEVKIADDGEILVKGPNVFLGYYKKRRPPRRRSTTAGCAPATSARSTRTASSRSPAARRRSSSPRAARTSRRKHRGGDQAVPARRRGVVIGDRRKYLICVVTLDRGGGRSWPPRSGSTPATLHENADVRASIQAQLDQINQTLARVEQVKKFAILPQAFRMTPASSRRR